MVCGDEVEVVSTDEVPFAGIKVEEFPALPVLLLLAGSGLVLVVVDLLVTPV